MHKKQKLNRAAQEGPAGDGEERPAAEQGHRALLLPLHPHHHAAPQRLLAPHHRLAEHGRVLQLRRGGVFGRPGQLGHRPPQQVHLIEAKALQKR